MAGHDNQPARLRLNADQRIDQHFGGSGFQRRFARIEQRHAVEANGFRTLDDFLNDRWRRWRWRPVADGSLNRWNQAQSLIQSQAVTQWLPTTRPVVQQCTIGSEALLGPQFRGNRLTRQLVIYRKVIANITNETLVVHPGRQHGQCQKNPAQ
ncbi:hypothetical protein D3C71_1708850 [compost metagenome]